MARRYEEEAGGFGFGSSSGRPAQGGGDFVDISKELQEVSSMNRRFSTLLGKIGTASDSASLRRQIHELQSLFTGKVKQVKNAITPQIKSSDASSKVQANRYLQSLQKEVSQFEEHLKDLRQQEQRHPASKFETKSDGRGDFSFEMNDDEEMGRASAARADEMQAARQMELTNNQVRQDEHAAMMNLESDMRDLHSMFVDMAAMVNDQGEMVNTIEDNVQSAEIKVEAAKESTRQAAHYQGKARRKKVCCLILTGCIVVAVIIVIVVVVTQTN